MNASLLAVQLLRSVHTGSSCTPIIRQLEAISIESLAQDLEAEQHRKAFWINLYNAFAQIACMQFKPSFSNWPQRIHFFSRKHIHIGGTLLSLNDVEHGMLRCSAIWWSMGYLRKPIPGVFERRFRLPLDCRIHFALNCGAVSCPAIAFYSAKRLNKELDQAKEIFLTQETSYNRSNHTITVSALFKWYLGDFGGMKGLADMLRSYFNEDQDKRLKIRFRRYDWSTHLHNFRQHDR